MKVFKNILVGVDLTHLRVPEISGLSPIAWEAIHRGVELARINSADLLFFSSLNIPEEALNYLSEEDRNQVSRTVDSAAGKLLDELIEQAKKEGVKARSKIVHGRGWMEITCQVLRDHHDLAVVGTRDLTGLRRMLFGNTAMKLFRRCPCPVLVTKVGSISSPLNILVATDLKPASQDALAMAMKLGRILDAHIHVLHVVEYPLDRLWSTGLADKKEEEYHRKVRHGADIKLREQLEKTDFHLLGQKVQIHMADGVGLPDVVIQHFIHIHHIHLLVMGTIGRGGIPGIMIGNTAERLLPEVQCSVLAVKPPDFQCPVKLE